MSFWLRIEPTRPRHFKWASLSDAAYRFADKVLCWGAENETAFVPAQAMYELAGTRGRALKLCTELEDCGASKGKQGILEPVEGGWRIHDAEHYWPPRAPVVAGGVEDQERAAARDRQRDRARDRKRRQRDKSRSVTSDVTPNVTLGHAPPLHSPSQNGNGNDNLQPDLPKDLTGLPARKVSGGRGGGEDETPSAELSRAPAPAREGEAPLRDRAQACLDNPHDAGFRSPEAWPEVVAVVEAFKRATGQPNARTGAFPRDPGIRRVIELLADGVTVAELETAIERAARSEWWRGGRKGLSSISLEVVRRALAEDSAAPAYESEQERVQCRNHLLTQAAEGEHGLPAKFWAKFGEGSERGALADALERRQPVTEADLPERLVDPFRRAIAKRKTARGSAESSPVPVAEVLARAAGGGS